MSILAKKTVFREEMIAAFEVEQALARPTVTTEAVFNGNEAVFLVSGSGGATAVTRGVDGKIPANTVDNTQVTVQLKEWHAPYEATGFNIFSSQGNQVTAMQRASVAVINRQIDSDIITELNTGTVNTGSATTATAALALKSKTILQNSDVPWDGEIFALITPAFEAYMLQQAVFTSGDYVETKPLNGGVGSWTGTPTRIRRWIDVNWIVHPGLPGVGTNAEKCFMYHRSAIGHAFNQDGMKVSMGYDERNDYSWSLTTVYTGTKVLQNSGIVVMNHDGSAYAPA